MVEMGEIELIEWRELMGEIEKMDHQTLLKI